MNLTQITLDQQKSNLFLPEPWKLIEAFSDSVVFFGEVIHLNGLVATHSGTQKSVHGSSGDLDRTKGIMRAYYELLERISILDHFTQTLPEKALTRKSLSNGIAIHSNPLLAEQNAAMELLERDAILTYWFRSVSPHEISSDSISAIYEFKTAVTGIKTFMTVIENKWMGFGTGMNQELAIQKSRMEAIQVACFTRDEPLVTELPEVASVELHLDFWLSPKGPQTLKRWLDSPESNHKRTPIDFSEITFQKVEQKIGNETLYTVKAQHPKLRELYFGVPEQYRSLDYSEILRTEISAIDYRSLPHPIS